MTSTLMSSDARASENAPVRRRGVLHNVQALRAIAAILVVFVHMQLPHNGIDVFEHPALKVFADFGQFGVDIFFAISGFIMLVSNWDSFQQPGASVKFFLQRAIRIYPAYWLALAPIAVAYTFARGHFMTGHVNAPTDLLASLLLYPQPVEKVLMPVSWTLVFEIGFYIVFALILRLDRRWLPHALATWFLIQVGLFAVFHGSSNAYAQYAATALPMEFILGVVVGMLYQSNRMRGAALVLVAGIIAAGSVWFECVHLGAAPFSSSLGRVLYFGIPAVLILYGAVGLEARGTVLAPAALVLLGDASYATYLWHFSLIGLLREVVLDLRPSGVLAEFVVIVVSLALILAFSLGVFRFFERPVTRWLNRLLAQSMSQAHREPRRLVPASQEK